jgi:hypothetical protein
VSPPCRSDTAEAIRKIEGPTRRRFRGDLSNLLRHLKPRYRLDRHPATSHTGSAVATAHIPDGSERLKASGIGTSASDQVLENVRRLAAVKDSHRRLLRNVSA